MNSMHGRRPLFFVSLVTVISIFFRRNVKQKKNQKLFSWVQFVNTTVTTLKNTLQLGVNRGILMHKTGTKPTKPSIKCSRKNYRILRPCGRNNLQIICGTPYLRVLYIFFGPVNINTQHNDKSMPQRINANIYRNSILNHCCDYGAYYEKCHCIGFTMGV
jgi:hypothetical protein